MSQPIQPKQPVATPPSAPAVVNRAVIHVDKRPIAHARHDWSKIVQEAKRP